MEIINRIQNTPWNRYPELIPTNLQKKIAAVIGLEKDQVVVGKGSNEVLQAILTATLVKGAKVCTLSPTFAVYRMLAEHRGAKVIESQLSESFLVDGDDLLQKSKAAALTILCNPNSPTGTVISRDLIKEVLKQSSGLVIVDEAYFEFSNQSSLPFLNEFDNLVITRTFSKIFALAGFRIGYGLMARELSQHIQKCMLPFNIDMPSAVAGEIMLDYIELIQDRAKKIVTEREGLIEKINRIDGLTALPSSTNFFLMKAEMSPKSLFNKIGEKGILIRDVSVYPRCDTYVRVTVGSQEENVALLDALESIS